MKIDRFLNNFLFDISRFEPDTLSSIVSFVRAHSDYNKITMLARNSKKSEECILNRCELLIAENIPLVDVRLAGLFVIMADLNSDLSQEWVSRVSEAMDEYRWSRAMAASYIIYKEILDETICKFA